MDTPITDADIVSPQSADSSMPPSADTVLELESMIKTNLSAIERNKAELKKLKEMLESALVNDETYRIVAQKAKDAAKEKGKAKAAVMQNPATKQLDEKVKDLAAETKELHQAQSEYLREYAKLSGTNEIEGEDGEVREIIYIAKLVKKPKR